MNRLPAVLACCAFVATAAPAFAQQDDTLRRWFTFVENDIVIEVHTESPGDLRITRGASGSVRVAARAPGGLPEAGLTDDERLMLTAIGADRVSFTVTVPGDARVSVRLPDRVATETVGTLANAATYQWDGETPVRRGDTDPSEAARSEPRSSAPDRAPHLAYSDPSAPASVDVRNLDGVRTLTVRWQGETFRVYTGRPARVDPGQARAIVLSPRGDPPQDLVIVVPRGVGQFALSMGGSTALLLADGRALVLCSPVIDQRLDGETPIDGGRRWFTFTPDDGHLDCRSPSRNRQESRTTP